MRNLMQLVESQYNDYKPEFPEFVPGDTINVHVKIKEGNKERVQQFEGIVIQRRGSNTRGETFTVRKISNGVGVERIFPVYSPHIAKIEVKRKGTVRRAKLYYLRDKYGKAAKVKEKTIVMKSSNAKAS